MFTLRVLSSPIDPAVCGGHNHFLCATGICVPQKLVCNGYNDCDDWSDETHCGNKTHTHTHVNTHTPSDVSLSFVGGLQSCCPDDTVLSLAALEFLYSCVPLWVCACMCVCMCVCVTVTVAMLGCFLKRMTPSPHSTIYD